MCCSDKLHCCPDGYTCDVAAGRCNKGNEILNLFAKHPSKPAPRVTEVRCPDGSECHTGMTCCENKPGGYGCCPLPYVIILPLFLFGYRPVPFTLNCELSLIYSTLMKIVKTCPSFKKTTGCLCLLFNLCGRYFFTCNCRATDLTISPV